MSHPPALTMTRTTKQTGNTTEGPQQVPQLRVREIKVPREESWGPEQSTQAGAVCVPRAEGHRLNPLEPGITGLSLTFPNVASSGSNACHLKALPFLWFFPV